MAICNLRVNHSGLLILRRFSHLLAQIIVMNWNDFVPVFTFFNHIKLMTLEELGVGPPQGADLLTFAFKSVVHNDDEHDVYIAATKYTAQTHWVKVKGHLQVFSGNFSTLLNFFWSRGASWEFGLSPSYFALRRNFGHGSYDVCGETSSAEENKKMLLRRLTR